MQFIGFGDGSDGDLLITGSVTDAPVDSACTGSAGSRTLTVGSGLAFAVGDIVLIHQSQFTNAGNWEFAKVESYVGTTLTLLSNLVNSYTTGAQIIKVKQYRSVTINGILSAKGWSGTVGGILAMLISGKLIVNGTISNVAKGFNFASSRGGQKANPAQQGESPTGQGIASISANGSGGGGASTSPLAGGYGGGNGTVGSGSGGGSTTGNVDLTTALFGGGGGGGDADNSAHGGIGGGFIIIDANEIENNGMIEANGSNGQDGIGGDKLGAGGGAGGSIMLRSKNAVLGSGDVTATGGAGGAGINGNGTTGGVGRIRIEACMIDGSTDPAASESEGGHSWCNTGGFIY